MKLGRNGAIAERPKLRSPFPNKLDYISHAVCRTSHLQRLLQPPQLFLAAQAHRGTISVTTVPASSTDKRHVVPFGETIPMNGNAVDVPPASSLRFRASAIAASRCSRLPLTGAVNGAGGW
jgi:hypothetical protein